jgi:hypothetical protein
MKKFLFTTTVLAGLAVSGAAFAADGVPAVPEATAQSSDSLLSALLGNAADLSASLSNVAENLNGVNGSINVATTRNFADMTGVVDALSNGGTIPFGSFSSVGANVYGQDLPASLLAVLDPTVTALGDLSTTAIGAMQSGSITATVDASGIVEKASSTAGASTTNASLMAETYGGISNTLAFQNIANNLGGVDGSVNLALADVNATVGKVATTAIGAMGSGSLTATISGNMAATANNSAAIVTALVGGPL